MPSVPSVPGFGDGAESGVDCPHDTTVPSTAITASSFDRVNSVIQSVLKDKPAQKVLVVFDVDNTLLTMTNDLGSDAWYEWQSCLNDQGGAQPGQVAGDSSGLLEILSIVYSISDMELTEPRVPFLLNALQSRGVSVMALTARSPHVRSATLRELDDAGLVFVTAPACGEKLCTEDGLLNKKELGLFAKEHFGEVRLRDMDFFVNRDVSYSDGIMMVSRKNKGALLELLLESSPNAFDALVVVDDSAENIRDFDALGKENMTLVYYTGAQERVTRFLSKDFPYEEVTENWKRIRETLCERNPAYWCAIQP